MSRLIANLLVGRTLAGRYRIEESIGTGGMSVIYRAMDLRLDRPVAVKVISLPEETPEARQDHRDRLRREAASAARIPPHPNVVQVYDHGTDPELDLDFIAMELLRGRDLRLVLRDGPIPLPEGVRLIREAARGVAAGHRAGIVHRDVKPANLLLVGDARVEAVKVLDFGIAKALAAAPDEDLTRTGVIPHSPSYASPEQLRAVETLTPASDVYQLGLVAYEILAGERPLTESEREAIRAGAELPVPVRGRWGGVPPALRSVVERALRTRPDDRFPDAAAFAEALAHAAESMDSDSTLLAPVERDDATRTYAPPPPTPARTAGWPHRRAAVVVAAVALLALVLALATRRSGSGEAPEPAPAELSEYDDEFRALTWRAYRSLQEESAAVQGEQAAEAVRRVVADLQEAWVRGDLERHLSHYADEVDFYGDRVSRGRVGELRRETMRRFPSREITLTRTAIEFPEPGRARALVTKSWDMRGERGRWTGEARQELLLALREGRWRVVGERDLEVLR